MLSNPFSPPSPLIACFHASLLSNIISLPQTLLFTWINPPRLGGFKAQTEWGASRPKGKAPSWWIINHWEMKQIESSLWSWIIDSLSQRLLPAADPADQQRVVDGELDHRVQLLVSLVQQIVQLHDTNTEGVKHQTWLMTTVQCIKLPALQYDDISWMSKMLNDVKMYCCSDKCQF